MSTQQPTTPNKAQPEVKPGTIQQPGKQSQQPQQNPQAPNPANKTGEAARHSEPKKSY